MNSYTKLLTVYRQFLLVTCLFFAVTLSVNAQEWKEFFIVNANGHVSSNFSVAYSDYSVLMWPDSSLGELSVYFDAGKLHVNFDAYSDAIGVAEYVVEHFGPPTGPPRFYTSKYRVFIDSSLVIADDDYFAVNEGSPGQDLNVLVNDTLKGGDTLTITDIAIRPEGAASITADGDAINYVPADGYTGMVYMTYVVCDEFGSCDAADVNICVLPEEGLAENDTIYLSTTNKSVVTAYMPTNGFEVESEADHGNLLQISAEAWDYTPNESFSGEDVFVMASDTLTRTVIVQVHHQNDENYYVNNDIFYTRVDSSITFDVRLNDFKAFPIHTYEEPDKGTLEIDSFGVFTYIPDAGYIGAVEFEYQVKPSSGIESGHVIIYVGDMPPQIVEVYNLVTPKNTPIVINYEIPLEDYHVTHVGQPSKGALVKHPNWTENMLIGCDSVSGWDLNVYTPNLNYAGADSFIIDYCVSNAIECTRVKVYVDVQDIEGLGECNCVDNCVWPGDVNADGIVDMDDLLKLGWHIGAKGKQRNYPNNSAWLGQYAPDWKGTDRNSGINLKYADSNGDGVLTEDDREEIGNYFLQKHELIPVIKGLKADYEFQIIPPSGPLDSGDLAVFEIAIGSENAPVVDMHGLRFTLNIPEELYDEGSVDVYFEDDSWLGHDAPKMGLHKEPRHGRLDVGFTRTNATTATGAGTIMTMTFIVVDDIDGFLPPGVMIPFNITATNIGGLGGDGNIRSIPETETQFFYRTAGQQEEPVPLTIDDKLFVFPNPSTDILKVHVNGGREIEEVELYDITGALRNRVELNSRNGQIDVSALAAGSYVLRVKATDGVVTRKVQIVR